MSEVQNYYCNIRHDTVDYMHQLLHQPARRVCRFLCLFALVVVVVAAAVNGMGLPFFLHHLLLVLYLSGTRTVPVRYWYWYCTCPVLVLYLSGTRTVPVRYTHGNIRPVCQTGKVWCKVQVSVKHGLIKQFYFHKTFPKTRLMYYHTKFIS